MLFASSEEQVEVTEWIKVAKETTVPNNFLVVSPIKYFRSAKRVFHRLAEQPCERVTEKFVRDHVTKPHRFAFHWVNKPHPVREIAFAGGSDLVEFLQFLWRHRQIGIKNH